MEATPNDTPAACSKVAERAWVQLIRAQRSALLAVERSLRTAGLPPLEWYDVLLELERGGSLRPRDLQDRLLLAQYNLSRLLDRMQAADMVERERCSEDARCQWIRITKKGKDLRRSMWPVYAGAIRDAVQSKLTSTQARQIGDLLECLNASSSTRS